ESDNDELSSFETFCTAVVWLLTDSKNQKLLVEDNVKSGRRFRRVGLLYKSVNWSEFDNQFAPPFTIWLKSKGFVEVTTQDLLDWAEFAMDDE
ncbi:MAG: hypothetical protein NXI22_02475, partial [bacterium]|nr:hypothetical protein [bacterium]